MERSIWKPYFSKALVGLGILSALLILSLYLERWFVF
jgi:hypothetical protein